MRDGWQLIAREVLPTHLSELDSTSPISTTTFFSTKCIVDIKMGGFYSGQEQHLVVRVFSPAQRQQDYY